MMEPPKPMTTFKEYADHALKTAVYPGFGHGTIYPVLGLGGEAGEVLEQYKKMMRDDRGEITPERRKRIIKELGDVLWYIWAVGYEINVTLDEIANGNAEKLATRIANGTLHGSGSDR